MRLLLLLLVALLGVVAVFAADLKLQLDADHPVTVTLADGTTRELTAAEFEMLAKERAEEQATLQTKDDDEVAEWQHQKLDEIRAKDPQFALLIDLAKRAFQEIQRHGYAQGYALAGFSEQEAKQISTDYYVELVLRAKKDPSSGVAPKTGTGTRKGEEETPLSYEVQLLLDAEKRFSVVAAWELSEKEPPRGQTRKRAMRLSIQPTTALLEREAKRDRSKPAVATWLLAGGMAMVAAGVLVMYNTRNPIPTPKPRRRSSDVWELVDENDKPIKMDKPEKAIKTDKVDKKND
ncbi:hypothetical protein JG687_00013807 [Phytophthora cactorum]|uniref:Uncharacterized protein n=1 Tax=Phytophthora cactorum TaxID=29920 RepID=A0A8T1U2M0_9STRA|nr:hypothetical protein PC128_g17126 [Phytophthora cactorum]KAG6951127.1 hypothetical protein JG687_00013807 [Phytophthora cactorum]